MDAPSDAADAHRSQTRVAQHRRPVQCPTNDLCGAIHPGFAMLRCDNARMRWLATGWILARAVARYAAARSTGCQLRRAGRAVAAEVQASQRCCARLFHVPDVQLRLVYAPASAF